MFHFPGSTAWPSQYVRSPTKERFEISQRWQFYPHQLVRYQFLTFHFPADTVPQFLQKLNLAVWSSLKVDTKGRILVSEQDDLRSSVGLWLHTLRR